MALFLGEKEIDQVYWGEKEIGQIYWGEKEIWSNAKIISLGSGTSWNIKQLYPNLYDKLTENNFFFRSATQASGTNSIRMNPGDSRTWAGFSCGLAKGYDKTTGDLLVYNYVNPGKQTKVEAVLVAKTDKLIYLGNSTSFDVKLKTNNYANLTEDNFLILSSDTLTKGNTYGDPNESNNGDPYSDYGAATSTLVKKYNKSTGILSCYIKLVSEDTGGVYHYFDFSATGSCRVYLMEKI